MDIEKYLEPLKRNKKILAIILFGSYAYGRQHKKSDIDICLVTSGKISYEELLDIPDKIDICIFEKLPLFLKKEVIKNGKILFVRDKSEFYKHIMKYKKLWEEEEIRKNKIRKKLGLKIV